MKKQLMMCAILALAVTGPVLAQDRDGQQGPPPGQPQGAPPTMQRPPAPGTPRSAMAKPQFNAVWPPNPMRIASGFSFSITRSAKWAVTGRR